MAKKDKTSLPDDGPSGLIIALSIAAAFVASVTLALIVGVALQYKSTTAAIMPEEAASPQQVTQPVKGQASQTDIEKDDISKPSGSEYVPDDSEPTGGPTGKPEDSEEPPKENDSDQADTSQAPSAQTPNSNSGVSADKMDPPQSSGKNSGSTVTITPNQPQPSGTQLSEGTGSRDFSGGRVLATTASNNNNDPVYHTKNCRSAKKIDTSDEKWYNSAADAEADGRRLCGICAR